MLILPFYKGALIGTAAELRSEMSILIYSDHLHANTTVKCGASKTSIKRGTLCSYSICQKVIKELYDNENGKEAIHCDGHCDWIHCHCPGLSDHFSSYLQKTKTSPFLCVYCMLKTQGDEIDPTIKDMRGIISSLQNKIDCSIPSNTTHNNHGSDSPM